MIQERVKQIVQEFILGITDQDAGKKVVDGHQGLLELALLLLDELVGE
jgi:hypothetical protein